MRAFALFSTREALWAGWKTASIFGKERGRRTFPTRCKTGKTGKSGLFLMRGKRCLNRVKRLCMA